MNLETYIQGLRHFREPREMAKALETYIKSLGFDAYSLRLFHHSENAANNVQFVSASSSMEKWITYYRDCHYYLHDSVIRNCYQSLIPLYWNVDHLAANGETHEEREMNVDLKEFGIQDGYDIPCHAPLDTFAILILYRKIEHAHTEIPFSNVLELFAYFQYFVSKFLELHIADPASDAGHHLIDAELRCLQLTAKGLTAKEVATKLRMSPHTANRHMSNAIKKLGVRNKYQAINLLGLYKK